MTGRDAPVAANPILALSLCWAVLSYGNSEWKLQSFGPLRETTDYGWALTTTEPGFPNKYYDPTNGTVSRGLITRTQA